MPNDEDYTLIRDRFAHAEDAFYEAIANRNFVNLDGLMQNKPDSLTTSFQGTTPFINAVGRLGYYDVDAKNSDDPYSANLHDIQLYFDNSKETLKKLETKFGREFVGELISTPGLILCDAEFYKAGTSYTLSDLLTKIYPDFQDEGVVELIDKYVKPLSSNNPNFVDLIGKYGAKKTKTTSNDRLKGGL